jgi:hypothetical protein
MNPLNPAESTATTAEATATTAREITDRDALVCSTSQVRPAQEGRHAGVG